MKSHEILQIFWEFCKWKVILKVKTALKEIGENLFKYYSLIFQWEFQNPSSHKNQDLVLFCIICCDCLMILPMPARLGLKRYISGRLPSVLNPPDRKDLSKCANTSVQFKTDLLALQNEVTHKYSFTMSVKPVGDIISIEIFLSVHIVAASGNYQFPFLLRMSDVQTT